MSQANPLAAVSWILADLGRDVSVEESALARRLEEAREVLARAIEDGRSARERVLRGQPEDGDLDTIRPLHEVAVSTLERHLRDGDIPRERALAQFQATTQNMPKSVDDLTGGHVLRLHQLNS